MVGLIWHFYLFSFSFRLTPLLLFCFYFSVQAVSLSTQAVSLCVSVCNTLQGKAFEVEGTSNLDPKLLKWLHLEIVFKKMELYVCVSHVLDKKSTLTNSSFINV